MATVNKDKEKEKDINVPLGVDKNEFNDTFNSKYTPSDKVDEHYGNMEYGSNNVKELTSKKDIVSKDVKKEINTQFVKPISVTQADAWLSNQLSIIQSGKTTYSDDVRAMMDKIANREKFTYDVDTDPLFQQALASATNSGKQAMQDTIGQASALTGGYGSTYATSVGNQTYNSFIEDAYDQLPQYYQMALESYQMEGDEMYRQLGMYSDADDREYNRNIAAYDATFNMRNRQFDEAYGKFRDDKSDAFAMANLQLNEHGQRVNDAMNYYNVASDMYKNTYEREYNEWMDSINMSLQKFQMQTQDAWSNKNFDEGVRQYEKTYAQNEDHFTRNMAFEDKWNQKNMDFQASENAKDRAVKSSSGGGGNPKGIDADKIPSNISAKAKSIENNGERLEYIASMVDGGYITEEQGDYLMDTNNTPEQLPLNERTWTMTDDGGNNYFWGIDGNGKAKDQYGNEMSMDDIYNELKKTIGTDAAKEYVKVLQNKIGITNYDWK